MIAEHDDFVGDVASVLDVRFAVNAKAPFQIFLTDVGERTLSAAGDGRWSELLVRPPPIRWTV